MLFQLFLGWIQRRFLWGGGMEQKKIVWVKWELVCLPKEKEGIGIRDLRKFNYANSSESGSGTFSIIKENCGLEY